MREEDRVVERIRCLVVRALSLPVPPESIDPDEPLFGGDATVDSIGSLEIVTALEGEFGFQIPDDDLRAELFDSVRSLAAYVLTRGKALAEAQDGDAADGTAARPHGANTG